jgi:hypothetical protein
MISLRNQILNVNSKIAKHWSKYGWQLFRALTIILRMAQ